MFDILIERAVKEAGAREQSLTLCMMTDMKVDTAGDMLEWVEPSIGPDQPMQYKSCHKAADRLMDSSVEPMEKQ